MLKLFSKKGEETDAPSTVETSTEEKKNVDKKKIALSSEIKTFGTYTAEIKFLAGISEKITVDVVEE